MKFKRMSMILLSIMMATTMVACGGDTGSSTTPAGDSTTQSSTAQDPQKQVIEVNFPTYLAGENVGGAFFLPQIERFNEKYVGQYKIVIEEVPQASYAEKIKQLAQQNKLPAIIHSPGSGGIDTQWFKTVAIPNNMTYDLSGFLNDNPDLASIFIQDSVDFCTVDGKLVTAPLPYIRPVGIYYNETMYQPDKSISDMTMDEFVTSLGDNKIALQTAENGWTTGLLLTAIIANQPGGADLLNSHADDKLYDYNNEIFITSTGILQDIFLNNASSNSIGAAYADAANAFMSKSAALICNGSWMSGDFDESSSDKWSNEFTGDEVKTGVYPGNVAIANPRTYGDFWVSNNASEDEIALALEFLKFRYSQDEIERFILAEGGSAPNIEYSDSFLEQQKETRILYELSQDINSDTIYSENVLGVMPASVADSEFGKLLPKLADGTLTPEEFCADLTKKAEEAR